MSDKSGVADQILSLPKGGGSIKGLGEKFQPDLHTGTGNISVPITLPPGRNGFQPQLALRYSTGSENGPWGLGWSSGVSGISRKTSKGIPQYRDKFDWQGNPIWHEDEDVFILSGSEDLVHVGNGHYRPRTEGPFNRIQRAKAPDGKPCWVITAQDGVRSIYGRTQESRLYVDESGITKIFLWALSETEDTNGNRILYEYKKDDGADLQADLISHPGERNHAYNQIYLKSIVYVNYEEPGTAGEKYLWKIELDYGEHDDMGNSVKAWDVRPDPFSGYRAGFEVRTARRCRRILIKRRLDGAAENYELIRSYELKYEQSAFSGISLLTEVIFSGYKDGVTESFPPITFKYTDFNPKERKYELFFASCNYLPDKSLSDPNYELVDLYGSGLPGILHTSPAGYRYWRNLGNMQFTVPRPLKHYPAGVSIADGGVQFADMEGNGSADLLVTTENMKGYYANDFSGEWQQFHECRQAPSFDLKDRDVRLVDLDGDGVIDVLATHLHHFLYIKNINRGDGLIFAPPVVIERRHDMDEYPDVFLSVPDQRVRLADMSGDGMQDLVLIHDRSIQYWPNAGYGKFDKRVIMRNAPCLPLHYDPKRLFLSDVNGDGLADLIYVDTGKVHLWINRCGNEWSDEIVIHGTPHVTSADSIRIADMRGTGTQGILWSYNYNLQLRKNYKYLDFTGGIKPLLMSSIDNHIGAKTTISYRPSTDYYISDMAEGRPWKTTLPFPVQVVSEVVIEDSATGNKLTTRYAYHHGLYNGRERMLQGFMRVDHFDAQEFPGDSDAAAPALTRNWFHPGDDVDFSDEYFDERSFADPFYAQQLNTPPGGEPPTRDALLALRGSVLRTELYGADGTVAGHVPYLVTDNSYKVEPVYLPADGSPENQKEVWFPHAYASRTSHYERAGEPRTNLIVTEFVHKGRSPPDYYYVESSEERTGFGRKPGAGIEEQEKTLRLRTETCYAELNRAVGAPVDLTVAYSPVYIVGKAKEVAVKDEVGSILSLARTYYDGPAFVGLAHGKQINAVEVTRGNPTRMEAVVLNDAIIAEAYGQEPPAIFTPEYGYHPDPELLGYYSVDLERREYNDRGQVTAIMDPLGDAVAGNRAGKRLTNVDYDRYGLFPVKIIDAAEFPTNATYDYVAMAPAMVEDPNGTETLYAYDVLGRLTAIAIGKTLSNGTAVGDSLNIPTVRYEYNLNFKPPRFDPATYSLIAEAEPIHIHTLKLEQSGKLVVHDPATDKYTNVFETYEYFDGFGRAIQSRVEAEPGPLDLSLHPDALPGDPDWAANRWVVSGWQEYNNKGEVAKKYQPRFSDTYAYMSEIKDPQMKNTPFFRNFFDPVGRVIKTINPDQTINTIQFTPWETIRYDPNDNGDQIPDDDPRYGRNVDGIDVKAWYQMHYHTPYVEFNDAWGRIVGQREDNGWWDAAGGQVPEGTPGASRQLYTTRFEYDEDGRLLRIFDARQLTWMQVDIYFNMATPNDLGKPRPTFYYIYDMLNNRISVFHTTTSGLRHYAFDAANNQVWYKDARGTVVTTDYDVLNRPIAVYERNNINSRLREHYAYRSFLFNDHDAMDNNLYGPVEVISDQAGQIFFTYNYLGLKEIEKRMLWADIWNEWDSNPIFWDRNVPEYDKDIPIDMTRGLAIIPGYLDGFTLIYSHDAMGRIIQIIYPDNTLTKIVYGDGGLLEKIDIYNNNSAVVTDMAVKNIDYNENGQRCRIAYGNGVVTKNTYDSANYRLSHIYTSQSAGSTLQDLGYLYDPVANILQITDNLADKITEACQYISNTRKFEYDPLNRLIKARGKKYQKSMARADYDPKAPIQPRNYNDLKTLYTDYIYNYHYDSTGNFLYNGEYSNASIKYKSGHPDLFNGAGNEVNFFDYDANGNMITSPYIPLLTWNYDDRLSYMELNTSNNPAFIRKVRNIYDNNGSRILKICKGSHLVVYINNLFEVVFQNNDHKLISCRYKHIYDGNIRVAILEDGTCEVPQPLLYFHNDHLGSAHIITGKDGSYISQEEYFPFGGSSDIRINKNRYLYNAKEKDEETGFYYYGQRYYDCRIGNWLSADPLYLQNPILNKKQLSNISLFAYAGRNPINRIDTTGLHWQVTGPRAQDFVNMVAAKTGLDLRLSREGNVTIEHSNQIDPICYIRYDIEKKLSWEECRSKTLREQVINMIGDLQTTSMTIENVSGPGGGFIDSYISKTIYMQHLQFIDRTYPKFSTAFIGHILREYELAKADQSIALQHFGSNSALRTLFGLHHPRGLSVEGKILADLYRCSSVSRTEVNNPGTPNVRRHVYKLVNEIMNKTNNNQSSKIVTEGHLSLTFRLQNGRLNDVRLDPGQ